MNAVISSTKNDAVKLAKSLHSRKGRMKHKLFLTESVKCVAELMNHAPDLISFFFIRENEHHALIEQAVRIGKTINYVAPHVMNALCESKTPQGIAAVCNTPVYVPPKEGFVVALDDVQDPQNVGTIIRTADAAGCSGVVLSASSADYLSPKAVRASMGSVFHLPVCKVDIIAFLSGFKQRGYNIVSTKPGGSDTYMFEPEKTCLIIGNESRGVSEHVQKLATHHIKIPMYGKAESLNAAVAAGILIYKIRT